MTLLLFILILSILVFVHELGHFLAAKKAGIKVEEFGFGLPPKIWSKKVGETVYSINALPIGGFVRLYGEEGEDQFKVQKPAPSLPAVSLSNLSRGSKFKIDGKKAYFQVSLLERVSVLLAGVVMNLVLGIVCFSIIYFFIGIPTKTGRVIIAGVTEGSPAKQANLLVDDEIVSVNAVMISRADEFINISKENAGKKIKLEIKREKDNPCKEIVLGGISSEEEPVSSYQCDGENMLIEIIPRITPPAGEGPVGIIISDTEMKKYPFYLMPFLGIREGFKESFAWGKEIVVSLKKMVYELFWQGKVPKDVAGPIGIFQITGQAAKQGILAVFQFVGILSVNLAIINILPLPALDGGRMVFLGYEFVFRKKVSAKFEILINNIGMLILLGLMVLITINDVIRLVGR